MSRALYEVSEEHLMSNAVLNKNSWRNGMRSMVIILSIIAAVLVGCSTMRNTADKAFINGDYKTALTEYKMMAAKGDSRADLQLAYMYNTGTGVAIDRREALRWYEKAAMDGDNGAARYLGSQFLLPKNGPPDYAQAFKWFKVAADRFDPDSELELSICYENGLGIARDHNAALSWLNKYVGNTNVAGATIQYKYRFPGGDNIGGFKLAVDQALSQAVQDSPAAQRIHGGVVRLSFWIIDGRAVDVIVLQSSGNPNTDATAIDILQKAFLPPMLASLSHMNHFEISLSFERPKMTGVYGSAPAPR